MQAEDYINSLVQGVTNSTHLAIAGKYLQTKEAGITQKLQDERLLIGDTKPISIKKSVQGVETEEADPQRIQEQKQQARQLLKELDLKELALKRQMAMKNSPARSPRQRSKLSEQDMQSLKELLTKQRKLQRQLARKDKDIDEQIERLKQYSAEQSEEMKEEQRRLRRETAEERIKLLQAKQRKRKEDYAITKGKLEELKKDNYLYERAEKAINEELKRQREQKLESLRQAFESNHVGLEEIKRHAQQYQETIERKRQERKRRLSELRSNSQYIRPPVNRYSNFTKQERQQLERQKKQKIESPYKSKIRQLDYSTEVREKNKLISPKKPQEQSVNSTRITLPEIKPLERTQFLKVGGEYLQKAKLARKRGTSLSSIPTQSLTMHHYTDYLRDSLPRYNFNKDQREIERVRTLLEPNYSSIPDLEKALLVANRLQNSAGWNSQRLANSIQAKLLILNKLK